jgi:hypothetical protein
MVEYVLVVQYRSRIEYAPARSSGKHPGILDHTLVESDAVVWRKLSPALERVEQSRLRERRAKEGSMPLEVVALEGKFGWGESV